MKDLGRATFNRLSAVSFLLCTAAVVSCVQSFRAGWRLSFRTSDARYTLKSMDGTILVVGPPGEESDEIAREIALRMSNADFQWSPPKAQPGGWFSKGEVRRGTATWEMFQRYRDRLAASEDLEPGERVWLKALDNPDKLVPAHMLLAIATHRWRDGKVWHDEIPLVFMPADPGAPQPRLADERKLRDDWDDWVDEPIVSVPYPVLLVLFLLLPVAWLTRPRGQDRKTARWGFNAISLTSFLICLTAITLWLSSLGAGDEWIFLPSPAPSVRGWDSPWFSDVRIKSSRGRLQLLKYVSPGNRRAQSIGYQRRSNVVPYRRSGMDGERFLAVPGFEFGAIDPKVKPGGSVNVVWIMPSPPSSQPGPRGIPGPLVSSGTYHFGPTFTPGVRSYIFSWWVLVLLSAILPALWIRRWWPQMRGERRSRANLCRVCGYDLRATPKRCPECGTERMAR